MAISKTKYLFWFTAFVLVMACVPNFSAPSVPTTDPNAIGTFIALTANAASTQTEAAKPTSTPTATVTPTPRNTDTPEPSATPTVVFRFFTPTIFVPTVSGGGGGGGGGGGSSSQNFACSVVSVSPANGTSFGSRVDFDGKWRVRNTGKKDWDRSSIDYLYLSGDRFHTVDGYDLGAAVKRGETVDIIVDMKSPPNVGTYTTNWTMQAGSQKFCTMSLTITVR